MAGSSVDVIVRFLTDTSKIDDAVGKVDNTGSKMKGIAKGVGLALGGAFAVNQMQDWIGAAEEAQSVSAGLAQALGNAGDASGEWSKHAEDLANTLQYKTGIDDEVIKRSQTILATFHDLSGATGQQSGAFDRATKAALDMSKTGFGDANSAATMLGKALEDPEKGLTALGRVGITFTDQQKEMIKGFVANGDKAGAMNEILKNVEGQVGGMAEKTATGTDKMKVAWGEAQESLGKALIPVLTTLAPILQQVAGFIQQNAAWLVPMVAGIVALNIALSLSPITLIAIAIAGLIVGLVLLWKNWDQVWTWITDAVAWAVAFIMDHWQMIIGAIFPIIGAILLLWNNWDTIWGWITGLLGTVVSWIGDQLSKVIGFFASIPGRIGSALAGLGDIIKAPFQWAWDQIIAIKDGIVGTFNGAIDMVKNAWNAFARFWNGIEVDVPGVTMPGPIPNIPGFTFGLPDLPMLAKGGIVTGPTLALLGERGAEAVVPLDRMSGAQNIVVNLTVPGLGADAPAIQRAVVQALRGYTTRSGSLTSAGVAV